MYSICYVVTDNENLRYYNQMLISIFSLRKFNPKIQINILTDKNTILAINNAKRTELEKWNTDIIEVDIPDSFSQKEKSRFIKTSMRHYVDGDFLFIDSDTIIVKALPCEICNEDLAMVLDQHTVLKNRINRAYVIEMSRDCGFGTEVGNLYFNSGVIWARDTQFVHDFFHDWHRNWEKGIKSNIVLDQPSLNYTNRKSGYCVKQLKDIFNVQISTVPAPIHYLRDAYIIHYYNVNEGNSAYLLSDSEIQAKGYQSEVVQNIIDDPLYAFKPCKIIPCDNVTERVLTTASFRALVKRYSDRKILFNVIELGHRILQRFQRK